MTVEALIARYGLAAVFFGAGIEGETAALAAGLLAHEGFFSLPAAMIAIATGSFTADQTFFAAGRRFRDHRWVKKIQSKPAFARALAMLERRPTLFILAFRFIYGLRTVSPVAIGTSRVPLRTFLPLNALAAAVWAAIFTTLGYEFGHGVAAFLGKLKPSRDTWLLVVVALLLVGALYQLWRMQRNR